MEEEGAGSRLSTNEEVVGGCKASKIYILYTGRLLHSNIAINSYMKRDTYCFVSFG